MASSGPSRVKPFPIEFDRPTKSGKLTRRKEDVQLLLQKTERNALLERLKILDSRIALSSLQRRSSLEPISPLVALPLDVLRSVFAFACQISREQAPSARFEIAISHTCSNWRTIALASPELWTTIRCQGLVNLSQLQEYLKRSRLLPLDITVQLSEKGSRKYAALVLETLMNHAPRWWLFSLRLPRTWPLNGLLAPFQTLKTPILHALEIYLGRSEGVEHLDSEDDDDDDGFEDDRAENAPRGALLRQSELRHLRMNSRCLSAGMPYSPYLTSLQLEGTSGRRELGWTDLIQILGSMTLRSLSIAGDVFGPPLSTFGMGGEEIPPDLISNIRHFRCSDANVSSAWFQVNAPHLELMILKNIPLCKIFYKFGRRNLRPSSVLDPDPEPFVVGEKRFPSLHTLALIDCKAGPTSAPTVKLAHATKNVANLFILHPRHAMSAFEDMRDQIPGSILWPELQTLTIELGMWLDSPSVFNACWELMAHRSKTLKSNCLLRMFEKDVELWEKTHRKSWNRIEESGRLHVMRDESRNRCVPWPTRDDGWFNCPTSEQPFLPTNQHTRSDQTSQPTSQFLLFKLC